MKDCRGTMSVIVPAAISSALLRKLSVARPRSYIQLGSAGSINQLKQLLKDCPFRMELGLGVRASSRQLANLAAGTLLTFTRRTDEAAELLAGDRPIFRARIARRGEYRAAHIVAAVGTKIEGRKSL